MKTSKLLPHPVKILALLLGSCLSILAAGKAHAQTADLFASVNHPDPTGPGAIFQYTPAGAQSTFVASVEQPRGLAFDCAGNLFVASTGFDNSGNSVGSILKVTPGGVVSTFTTGFPNNYFLEDIKFDSMGNLFVMANNESDPLVASTIFKVSPGGGVTIFGTLPGQGFGLAFDSMGNLFAADASDKIIYEFTPAGMRSVFSSAFLANQGPIGLAFNSAGNLFVSTSDNTNGQIFEFAPNGTETTFATGLTNNPRGLAFDSAGNLFVAEVSPPSGGSGDILKFTPGGVETFFATPVGRPQGNGGPEFLAFPPPTACACGNPSLGAASTYAVLQFGNNTATISAGGATGDVGIGPKGTFGISGSSFVTGTLYLSSGDTYSRSGSATIGSVAPNSNLSAAISNAQAASQSDAAMPCTQSYSTWNSSRTVTGVVGNNVICVGNVALAASEVVTLTGPAGAKFVINVTGSFSMSGGSAIRVAGGVRSQDVTYNITGSGNDAVLSGGSGVDGSLLAPNRAVQLSAGVTNGQVIAGGRVIISGGAQVICPSQR
jgi:choice-of-anchor A domain-containing protein